MYKKAAQERALMVTSSVHCVTQKIHEPHPPQKAPEPPDLTMALMACCGSRSNLFQKESTFLFVKSLYSTLRFSTISFCVLQPEKPCAQEKKMP